VPRPVGTGQLRARGQPPVPLLKLGTPGPYTFILEATKEVPRRVSHPSRRTIGLRVPDHKVLQELLALFGQPLLATTLIPPGETEPLNDAQEIRERFQKQVQAIVDAGACPMAPTTVIDLSGDEPVLVRQGRGDPARWACRPGRRRISALGGPVRGAQSAAVTTISTFHSGLASSACTVARGGVWPGTTQASQTSFIAAKSARSARKIWQRRILLLSVPARASSASMAASTWRTWPDVLRAVGGHLAGQVAHAVVHGHFRHAGADVETLNHQLCPL
jgi:hypothetical protein